MKKLKTLSILVTISLFGKITNAEFVNAIFTGNWYNRQSVSASGYDSCSAKEYTGLDHLANTPEQSELDYLNKYDKQPDCNWVITKAEKNDSFIPLTFPYNSWLEEDPQFEREAWVKSLRATPNAATYFVSAECKPKTGLPYKRADRVEPLYICPDNSRNSFTVRDEYSTEIIGGCTTTPAVCAGDVVGRNLNFPGIGYLGHVGIGVNFYYNLQYEEWLLDNVVEVIKDNSIAAIIDTPTFDEFKNTSDFWGEKYGLPGLPKMTNEQANSIVDSAMNQASAYMGTYQFEPPYFIPLQNLNLNVYNQTTHTWQLQDDIIVPVFRCDTFVDWNYYEGLGMMILPFHSIKPKWEDYSTYEYDNLFDTPRSLFHALTSTRLSGPDSANAHFAASNQPDPNMEEIVTQTNYLVNQTTSRDAKIQYFWKMLNNNPNSEQKNLAFGSLSYLKPVSLIPNLIANFQISDEEDKENYLRLIISTMQIDPSFVSSSDDLKAVIAGQNFLTSQVQTQTNPDLLKLALYGYISVTPYSQEKALNVYNTINQLAQMTKTDIDSYYVYQFMLDVNDPSGNSLNQLISNINNLKYQSKFNQFLIGQIQNGLRASLLTYPNQANIKQYLVTQIQNSLKASSIIEDSNNDEEYHLINSYGLFTNDPAYLAKTILDLKNTSLQASLIMMAFSDPWNKQTQKLLIAHKDELVKAMNNGKATSGLLSVEQSNLPFNIQAAINKLQESYP